MHEHIVEEYNQEENSVTITKRPVSGAETQQVIQSDSPLQHMVSLIYNFRSKKEFLPDELIDINLPLTKLQFKFTAARSVKVPKGRFEAYQVQSVPRKYNFWLSQDDGRIPLMIDGVVGFAKTRMMLVDYELHPQKKEE